MLAGVSIWFCPETGWQNSFSLLLYCCMVLFGRSSHRAAHWAGMLDVIRIFIDVLLPISYTLKLVLLTHTGAQKMQQAGCSLVKC